MAVKGVLCRKVREEESWGVIGEMAEGQEKGRGKVGYI